MKKLVTLLLVVLLVVPLCASSVFFKDVAVRIGNTAFLYNSHSQIGLHAITGISAGLTQKLELNIEAIVPLVPGPFSDCNAGFEVGYSLLGERVSEKKNSGMGINTVLSLGLFCSNHAQDGRYLPTYLTLRITPLSVGAPYSGRRESLLPFGVAYNFRENTFSVFGGVIMYDHYFKGTWRQDY